MTAHTCRLTSLEIVLMISACMTTNSVAVAKQAKDVPRQPAASARIADSGAVIEPSRRMRFEGSPWDYEVRIALPPSYYQTDKRYPVLWVTDGSVTFEPAVDVVTSSARNHVPEMIVVAIGDPPEARKEFMRRRAYAFSSTQNDICSYQEPGGVLYEKQCQSIVDSLKAAGMPPVDQLGGAPKFLKFMIKDIRQTLSNDYRLANDHTLFGYSAGGNFCTYALLAGPEEFDRYICGSPNLNMDAGMVLKMEEQYAKTQTDMKAKVFFSAGEGEILQGGVVSAAGVVSWMARMAEILKVRAYPSLELHARIFPGEVHDGAGVRMSLYWGLRTLWSEGDAIQAAQR